MSADIHSRPETRPVHSNWNPLERIDHEDETRNEFDPERPRVLRSTIIGLTVFAVLWGLLIAGSLREWW